ncbi:SusC/RagA family TonB-linked outer membrane protein [Ichthyobacterium seriolicida]|uniref:TonB-dependent receptor n=1 Tax=Ichthyobacterium seriolicida TaxID=242600 RepID=A0A1J1E9B7_9FLAO|nr:SusC/RagA family TonB-linked outer membrane protein [Ichthyobacterium seriolicida]BAV94499.1 TonB-dependent receptor [Ichthyobacterium seriolicida]
MRNSSLLMFLTTILTLQISFAQLRISGTVNSKEDNTISPLTGVSIVIKGGNKGVSSDLNGEFSIDAEKGDVLEFSFMGMKTVLFNVEKSDVITIDMIPDSDLLDEVVVMAYGSEKSKRELVGAVGTVGKKVIENQQVTSVARALQGSVPGLTMITSGGQPGSNPTIRIRGIASINASASPLYVVDGVPLTGNINTISSDQIESMTVLKDAASSAVYGSRAANGVILITTKKGTYNSPPKVSINTVIGGAIPAVKGFEFLSVKDYMELSWEGLRNSYLYTRDKTGSLIVNPKTTPRQAAQNATDNLISKLGYNPYGVNNPVGPNGKVLPTLNKPLWETDWEKAFYRKMPLRKDVSLSVSGGGDDSKYFVSANYLDTDGPVKTSNFERFATRLNLSSRVNDWLNFTVLSSFSGSHSNVPRQSGSKIANPMLWVNRVSSIYPLYARNDKGEIIEDDNGNPQYDYSNRRGKGANAQRPRSLTTNNKNPAGQFENDDVIHKRRHSTLNGIMDLRLYEGLHFKQNVSFTNYTLMEHDYDHYKYGDASRVGGRITEERHIHSKWNSISSLEYQKNFGLHNFDAKVINEFMHFTLNKITAEGERLLPEVKVLNGAVIPSGIGGAVKAEKA